VAPCKRAACRWPKSPQNDRAITGSHTKHSTRYESGGSRALSKALDELAEADPIIFMHIMSAFFPDLVRERIKDDLAENGMTEDARTNPEA
jgi:hypothetical protein